MPSSATFNVCQVGLGFFLLFVQFNSRGYIQEAVFASVADSRGIDPHAGYYGLSTYYFVFTFANLFISPVIDRLGIQMSMAVGAILTILYEIGFFHLNELYYYFTCALSGIGAALIWPSMGTYLTLNSTEKTTERNSSIVWAMSQASQVVGGVILFLVFHHAGSGEDHISDAAQRWTTICFTISLAISIFVFGSLRNTPEMSVKGGEKVNLFEELGVTFRLMFTKRMVYLAVVFAYTGIIQSFWTSIYPTCISFTRRMSDDRMTVVAASSVASGLGQIAVCIWIAVYNRTSRGGIVLLGFVLHLFVFVGVFLFFPINASLEITSDTGIFEPNIYVTLILSLLLGFGDGCWNTQVYAIVVDVFPHCSNPAFALFNFYQSLLTSASLFYSSKIFLTTHLIILAVTSVGSLYCFLRVEGLGRLDYAPPHEKMAADSPQPSERSVSSTGPLVPV